MNYIDYLEDGNKTKYKRYFSDEEEQEIERPPISMVQSWIQAIRAIVKKKKNEKTDSGNSQILTDRLRNSLFGTTLDVASESDGNSTNSDRNNNNLSSTFNRS